MLRSRREHSVLAFGFLGSGARTIAIVYRYLLAKGAVVCGLTTKWSGLTAHDVGGSPRAAGTRWVLSWIVGQTRESRELA